MHNKLQPVQHKPINKLKSQSGFSLIETLVAFGVMSILMVGFMQMMSNQAKQTKGLEETLARLDLEKTLQTYLADGSICGATLAGPTPQTFNVANLATTSFSVSTIPAGAQAGAPSLIAVNQKASSLSNSLMVASITYKSLQATGVADKYNMDLEVSFTGGIRPLRPLLFKMLLYTTNDTTAGVKRVTGCNSGGAGANQIPWYTGTNCIGKKVVLVYWSSGTCLPQESCSGGGIQQLICQLRNRQQIPCTTPAFWGFIDSPRKTCTGSTANHICTSGPITMIDQLCI